MKRNRSYNWKSALGAGVFATVAMLPTARAELVYEPEVSPNAPAQVRADDREATRGALDSSERAKATIQASQAAPAAQPVLVPVQVQPQVQIAPAVQEAPAPEVQSLSKTELMRRERTRTELKNEDLLEERLEELRLRDEKRRTQQMLGDNGAPAANADQAVAPVPGLAQPQNQVVVSPVTEHPGQEVVAPVPSAVQAQQYSAPAAVQKTAYTPAAQAQMDQVASSQAAMSLANAEEAGKSQFYIAPHGGVSSMSTNGPFNVSGKFALGVSAGTNISDNLAFEVGYTYSEYGVSYGQAQNVYGQTYETYALKQNVIDATLKLFFLGPDSKIRPFVSGGFGYAMASTNFSQQLLASMGNYPGQAQDYKTNAYLGTIGAGVDMKVNKTVSIGAQFKYYTVLSSNQDGNLPYGAYGVAPGALASPFGLAQAQPGAPAGASLSESSFYTMTAGVSFAF